MELIYRRNWISLFATMPRLALGCTHLPVQWLLKALSPGVNNQSMKLTTHPNVVSKLRIYGALPSFSLVYST
jgi:hypothetical protein